MITLDVLFAAILSLAIYVPISRGKPRHLCGMPVDGRIPFLPIFVIPYLSLFWFWPLAMVVLYTTPEAIPYYVALFVVGLLYAVFSPIISCGAQRADASGPGVLRACVRFVYRVDGKANNDVFPSTHVYLSTITGFYLTAAFPAWAPLIWLVAASIAVSTVFIKQHNLMDIGGGVLWASAAILASFYLAPLV